MWLRGSPPQRMSSRPNTPVCAVDAPSPLIASPPVSLGEREANSGPDLAARSAQARDFVAVVRSNPRLGGGRARRRNVSSRFLAGAPSRRVYGLTAAGVF